MRDATISGIRDQGSGAGGGQAQVEVLVLGSLAHFAVTAAAKLAKLLRAGAQGAVRRVWPPGWLGWHGTPAWHGGLDRKDQKHL